MSKFDKALQQAEQELALRRGAELEEAGSKEAVPSTVVDSPSASPSVRIRAATEPAPARTGEDWPAQESVESPGGVEEHLVSLLAPTSLEAEQYRALRHLVEQLHKADGLSIVAVSSAGVGDGKTTTAINLAGALAQAPEARVLLVDADLRRSSVRRYLGLDESDGHSLVDAILGPTVVLDEVAKLCPPFNLSVLPAGRLPSASYELLKSPRLEALLAEARRRYDYVVLDTPPLVPFPDCRLIAKWVDGFLLVVDAHRTPRKLVAEALDVIDPTKIIGLIFNSHDRALSQYHDASGPSDNGNRAQWRRWASKRENSSLRGLLRSFRIRLSPEE